MLAIGGQAPKAIRNVECFDFKEERWFQVTLTLAIYYHMVEKTSC